jgi:uncharacterized membrane protein
VASDDRSSTTTISSEVGLRSKRVERGAEVPGFVARGQHDRDARPFDATIPVVGQPADASHADRGDGEQSRGRCQRDRQQHREHRPQLTRRLSCTPHGLPALRYAALVARSGRYAALALLVLGVLAGVAVPLAACARDSATPLVATSIRVGYAMGHLVCHQRPDRSFFSCGQQWPVCGRCAGLYMGFACGGLVGLAAIAAGGARREVSDATRRWRLALVVAGAADGGPGCSNSASG